ncbi:hypothetical protein [Nocardia concava]|uniref:hypothetical protein n=1 Tax=Nocardia concava TaxID=257281 RepID=UPI000594D35B|nr:hypothetical protein [Nocardia concava]
MMRAVGFILRPASGQDIRQLEHEMEQAAAQLGFTWMATFFADFESEGNYVRMVNRILREGVDALFLPGVGHLSSQDIEVLATHCDVYLVAEIAERRTNERPLDESPR